MTEQEFNELINQGRVTVKRPDNIAILHSDIDEEQAGVMFSFACGCCDPIVMQIDKEILLRLAEDMPLSLAVAQGGIQ